MKNNVMLNLTFLTIVALIISLVNANEIDTLTESINNVQLAIRQRQGTGLRNVTLISDLITAINNSGLHPDSIRFLVNFIHANLNSLPTLDELGNLIKVLKELETNMAKSDSGFSGMADYLSKFGKGPGPGPSGGSSGAAITPSK